MAADPYGYLRSCAGCSAHLLTHNGPGPLYCRKCTPGLMDGTEQLDPAVRFDARLTFYGEDGTEWIPVSDVHDGGLFLAKVLGRPDMEPVERHVNAVRPRFSYAKLSRVRGGR